jgi:hypothetical protein
MDERVVTRGRLFPVTSGLSSRDGGVRFATSECFLEALYSKKLASRHSSTRVVFATLLLQCYTHACRVRLDSDDTDWQIFMKLTPTEQAD